MVRDWLWGNGFEGFGVEKEGQIEGDLLAGGVVIVAAVGWAVNAWKISLPWGGIGSEYVGDRGNGC